MKYSQNKQQTNNSSWFSPHPVLLMTLSGSALLFGLFSTAYMQSQNLQGLGYPVVAVSALCIMAGILLGIWAFRSISAKSSAMDGSGNRQFGHEALMPSATPQRTINELATMLVPHNIADSGQKNRLGMRTAQEQSPRHNIVGSLPMSPFDTVLPNPATGAAMFRPTNGHKTVLQSVNEMSTLLVPHNVDSARNQRASKSRHN